LLAERVTGIEHQVGRPPLSGGGECFGELTCVSRTIEYGAREEGARPMRVSATPSRGFLGLMRIKVADFHVIACHGPYLT
jgi:hypothetical protein